MYISPFTARLIAEGNSELVSIKFVPLNLIVALSPRQSSAAQVQEIRPLPHVSDPFYADSDQPKS